MAFLSNMSTLMEPYHPTGIHYREKCNAAHKLGTQGTKKQPWVFFFSLVAFKTQAQSPLNTFYRRHPNTFTQPCLARIYEDSAALVNISPDCCSHCMYWTSCDAEGRAVKGRRLVKVRGKRGQMPQIQFKFSLRWIQQLTTRRLIRT